MSEVVYRTLESRDENQVKAFLYEHYYGHNPVSNALALESPRECRCYVEAIMADVVADDVSVVAEDRDAKEMIGVVVAVITTPEKNKIPSLSPYDEDAQKMRIILDLRRSVLEGFNVYSTFGVPCALHFCLATVKPGYQNRGLLSSMVKHSEEKARQKGIRVAYTETTNELSKKVGKNLGYTTVNEIKYSDYVKDGQAEIYSGISCWFGVKQIDTDESCGTISRL